MSRILFWLPRILILLLIGFFLLMGLDVFSMHGSFAEQLFGYFIHSIPALLLLLVLTIAKKNPMVAGVLFLILGVVATYFFRTYLNLVVFIIVTVIPLLVGLAFVYEGTHRRKT